MDNELALGIELAKQGKNAQAYRLIRDSLTKNPREPLAWIWLAEVVDDPAKKAECYQRVLRIDPDNQIARKALNNLKTPIRPPVIPLVESPTTLPTHPPSNPPSNPPTKLGRINQPPQQAQSNTMDKFTETAKQIIVCSNCEAVNLFFSPVCIRCNSKLPFLSLNVDRTDSLSWEAIFNTLISGADSAVVHALSIINVTKDPQLIPALVQICNGRNPTTNNKVKIDDKHKAMAVIALGLIGTEEASKEICKSGFWEHRLVYHYRIYALGICQPTPEGLEFAEASNNGSVSILSYFAYEILKKYAPLSYLQKIISSTKNELEYPYGNEPHYSNSSPFGLAFVAVRKKGYQQEYTAFQALAHAADSATDSHAYFMLDQNSPDDIQREWKLLRSLEVLENILERFGDEEINALIPQFKKPIEIFMVACLLARRSTISQVWQQVIIDVANESGPKTKDAVRFVAYDSLVRYQVKNPDSDLIKHIQIGLQNKPAIRSGIAASVLYHGLDRLYPDVLGLINDHDKYIRFALASEMPYLYKWDPQTAIKTLRQLITDNDKDVRKIAERNLADLLK